MLEFVAAEEWEATLLQWDVALGRMHLQTLLEVVKKAWFQIHLKVQEAGKWVQCMNGNLDVEGHVTRRTQESTRIGMSPIGLLLELSCLPVHPTCSVSPCGTLEVVIFEL